MLRKLNQNYIALFFWPTDLLLVTLRNAQRIILIHRTIAKINLEFHNA
jgi:hypothetical protein